MSENNKRGPGDQITELSRLGRPELPREARYSEVITFRVKPLVYSELLNAAAERTGGNLAELLRLLIKESFERNQQ
jgi:hypothetical protein